MTLAQGVNHSNLSKIRDCKRRSFLWSYVTTLHDAVTYEDSNTFWLTWILPPSNKTFSYYVSFFCGLQVIYNTNRPLNIKTLHQITHVLVIVDLSFFCLLITWRSLHTRSVWWQRCHPNSRTVERHGWKCNNTLQPQQGFHLLPDVLVQAAPRRDTEANNVYVSKRTQPWTMNLDSVKRSSQPPSLMRYSGTLTVKNLVPEDKGLYFCAVSKHSDTNAQGRSTKTPVQCQHSSILLSQML